MVSRRSLLQGMFAAPIVLLSGRWTSGQTRPSVSTDYGVASGDPRPDAIVLWTRVPESAQRPTGDSVVVHYEIATSATFSPASIAGEGDVVTDGTADYTVKVSAGGLIPHTRYYYRFFTETGYRSVVGRTKTAPAPEDHPSAVTFALVSCQNFTQGFYPVLAHLAQDQVDFCVHLGDNIYETGHVGFEPGYVREDTIGGGRATDLPTYRQKYQLYLSDPHLREVRRRFPWIVLWDDHELFDNYAGAQVLQDVPVRQWDAYTAFLEYMPILPPVSPSADGRLHVRLYRQFTFGNLLDVFALDERQYRDGVVCQRDVVVTSCPELEEPTRTMLGDEQKSWLQAALRASTAQWKCLLNEVMMMRFALIDQGVDSAERLPVRVLRQPAAIAEDVYVNLDAWDGYPAERAALLQFIADQGIRNVVVCTGDVHNCFAGVLRPDFQDPASPAVAVECVGGSVSSFGTAELLGRDLTRLGRRLIQPVNPHIKYLDLIYHVYTKVTVTSEAMDIQYIAVNTVAQPTSPAFLLQRFTVPNGEPQLIFQ